MHRRDGRQEIDRRTLLAKGAAFAAPLVTGCGRKESRGRAVLFERLCYGACEVAQNPEGCSSTEGF
jgi:hypothetical protein